LTSKEDVHEINIVANVFKFSINTWVSFIINFFAMIIITRLFSPNDLGKINIFIIIGTTLLLFVPLGVDSAYLRLYYEPPNGRSVKYLMIDGLRMSGYVLIVLICIGFVFKSNVIDFIVDKEEYDILVALFLYLISSVFLRFLNLTYRLEGMAKLYTIQAIFITFASKASYLPIGFVCPNYRVAIWIISISNLIVAVFFFKYQFSFVNFKKYNVDKNSDFEMLKIGLPLLPYLLLTGLDLSISRFIIRFNMGFNAVGIYTAGVQFSALFTMISSGFNNFWAPFIYSGYNNKFKIPKIQNMTNYITMISILFVGIVTLFQDLIFLIVGNKYENVKLFFSFLFIAPACILISETTSIGISISKKTYWFTFISLISFSINILISFMLINMIGLLGMAIASSVASMITLCLKTLIGSKYYKIYDAKRNVILAIIFLLSICLLNYLLRNFILLRYATVSGILLIAFIIYNQQIEYLLNILSIFRKNKKRKIVK
jgi:O-antigen/teichoic acid export membrane protein